MRVRPVTGRYQERRWRCRMRRSSSDDEHLESQTAGIVEGQTINYTPWKIAGSTRQQRRGAESPAWRAKRVAAAGALRPSAATALATASCAGAPSATGAELGGEGASPSLLHSRRPRRAASRRCCSSGSGAAAASSSIRERRTSPRATAAARYRRESWIGGERGGGGERERARRPAREGVLEEHPGWGEAREARGPETAARPARLCNNRRHRWDRSCSSGPRSRSRVGEDVGSQSRSRPRRWRTTSRERRST